MTEIKCLDHGYVRLIESWGHGEAGEPHEDMEVGIIEAARQSTQGSFRGWDKDKKLLKYLYENKHCYDDQTEVLVLNKGFIPWSEVTIDDCLGQLDLRINSPNYDSLVYERPIELICSHHKGPMYCVDHGGVDLLVTLNHKMLVKQKVREGYGKQVWPNFWRLKNVSDLGDISNVRYRKHVAYESGEYFSDVGYPANSDTGALLELIGFFIGDGSCDNRDDAVLFHLRKQRKIKYLKSLAHRLDWNLEERVNDNYLVRCSNVGKLFRDKFYTYDGEKTLSGQFLRLNQRDSLYLIEGLKQSDGSKKRGAYTYSTTSKALRKQLPVIATHAGICIHENSPTIKENEKHKDLYRFMFLSRRIEPVINQGRRDTSIKYNYDGKIYCATTNTGTVVVRRNGKIVVSGNSTPFEFSGMVIEVRAPIFVFREWVRHRTQSYNEMSARYAPLPDLNYMPTIERLMGTHSDNKNKQAGAVKDSKTLTIEEAKNFQFDLAEQYKTFEIRYQRALAEGVPKELARCGMPVGRYSQMRAQANLRNWLAFLTLRMDINAQYEIRVFANAVGSIISSEFPQTWELFCNADK